MSFLNADVANAVNPVNDENINKFNIKFIINLSKYDINLSNNNDNDNDNDEQNSATNSDNISINL